MPSDKQGKQDQGQSASQRKDETPAAPTTHTLPSRPKDTTTNTTMPKNSGGVMAHGSLSLLPSSTQSAGQRRDRQTSQQNDPTDLFAVGAWVDAQMGGAGPDDDFDQHLQQPGSRRDTQGSSRR